MKTYDIAENFITNIVLNFELTPPVSKILSRIDITEKNGKHTYTSKDSTLMWNPKRNVHSELRLDLEEKKIYLTETYKKKITEGVKRGVTEQIYTEEPDKNTNYLTIQNICETYHEDKVVNNTEIVKKYKVYQKERLLGLSNEETKILKIKDKDGDTILNTSDVSGKFIYTLPSGDKVNITEKNGLKKYYLCNKDSLTDEVYVKEISEADASHLFSLGPNPYALINDDLIHNFNKARIK